MNFICEKKSHFFHCLCLGILALSLSGCINIPQGKNSLTSGFQASKYEVAEKYWWQRYKDPQLDALMKRALLGSPSLAIAAIRIQQAQAAIEQHNANSGLHLGSNTNLSRELASKHSLIPPPYAGTWLTNSRTALDFRYEFDWWGKNRALLNAAIGEARAAEAEYANARLVLTAAVAQAYFTYQTESARLKLCEMTLAHYKRLLKLNQLRIKHGLDPISIQLQTQGNLAEQQFNQAKIEMNAELARSQLQALLGLTTRELPLHTIPLPIHEASLPRQVEINLLARRPDLQAARWRVEASTHRIEAAKAEFYPNVNLAAFLGFSSVTLNMLLKSGSEVRGIGPAIHIPIFDSGRIKANFGVSRTNAELAIAQYNLTLVNAIKDVTDQLTILKSLALQQHSLHESLKFAQSTRKNVASRVRQGLADDISLIQTKLNVLAQQDLSLQLMNLQMTSHIQLIHALGGSYIAPREYHG